MQTAYPLDGERAFKIPAPLQSESPGCIEGIPMQAYVDLPVRGRHPRGGGGLRGGGLHRHVAALGSGGGSPIGESTAARGPLPANSFSRASTVLLLHYALRMIPRITFATQPPLHPFSQS